jgi:heme exporter protein D
MPLAIYVLLAFAYAGIVAAVALVVVHIWRSTSERIRAERAREARAGMIDLVGRQVGR